MLPTIDNIQLRESGLTLLTMRTKRVRRRREMISAVHGIRVLSASLIAPPNRGGLSAITRHSRYVLDMSFGRSLRHTDLN
jgi:hypothetical protein